MTFTQNTNGTNLLVQRSINVESSQLRINVQKTLTVNVVSTLISGSKWKLSRRIFIDVASTLKWGCLFYVYIWLSWFHQHGNLSWKLLLVSSQIQRWINVDNMTLIQRWYHVDWRHDVFSTYISTLKQRRVFVRRLLCFSWNILVSSGKLL